MFHLQSPNNNHKKQNTYSHTMVSRRKILSRSRDDLNADQPFVQQLEEDVWYQKDKLFKVIWIIGEPTNHFNYDFWCD